MHKNLRIHTCFNFIEFNLSIIFSAWSFICEFIQLAAQQKSIYFFPLGAKKLNMNAKSPNSAKAYFLECLVAL